MKLVVIGAQWGDEGKGKLVDFLTVGADIVLRYSGGANAGHTVVVGENTYKFHLIPSGILYPDQKVVLGIGMVIDLETFFQELDLLTSMKIDWQGRVFLAMRAHLVLPSYKALDIQRDKERRKPLGTTGRGIGVTYALKAHRDGVRMVDMFDSSVWQNLAEEDRTFLKPFRDRVRDMMVDVSLLMHQNRKKNILFEGAQGSLLDLDFGTYPFVSSGISSAAGAAIGGGIGPSQISRVMGVFKAYSTRVGNGPFPSEFKSARDGNLGEIVRETGHEYGVTTGRPRRCGYLDLVGLKYACRSNAMNALILTHLDIYDDMKEVKICTAYEVDGRRLEEFPASIELLQKAKPILKTFKGWQQSIRDRETYQALPEPARQYIEYIEKQTATPIDIVSVGNKRKETIVRQDPWTPS